MSNPSSQTPVLLQCNDLSKSYQEGKLSTDVLRHVSFDIHPGEMMAIVGSSGSGKSTLLHLLGGLDSPTSGEVIFKGSRSIACRRQTRRRCVTASWALSTSSIICCPISTRWRT